MAPKSTQNQPEGSGAPKKILGRGEFDGASKKVVKKTNKTDKTDKKTTKPRIVSAKELKASGLSLRDFLNKERGLTRRDNKKKVVKKKVSAQTSNDAQTVQKVISKKTRTDFKKSGAFKGIDSAPGDNKKPKIKRKSTSNIIGNKNFVSDKKKKNKLPKQMST